MLTSLHKMNNHFPKFGSSYTFLWSYLGLIFWDYHLCSPSCLFPSSISLVPLILCKSASSYFTKQNSIAEVNIPRFRTRSLHITTLVLTYNPSQVWLMSAFGFHWREPLYAGLFSFLHSGYWEKSPLFLTPQSIFLHKSWLHMNPSILLILEWSSSKVLHYSPTPSYN